MADAAWARSVPVEALVGGQAVGDVVPVLAAVRPVFPGGGLRKGSVVGVDGSGAASIGLALAAGVTGSEEGGWCGVVGVPDFGVVAAVGMGAVPERILLVDEPGERWPDVVAALIEAVDLVLVRTPESPSSATVRRLSALARKHGCVLALTGAFAREWPGIRLRLRLDSGTWDGLGDGHGVLEGRRVEVVAEGRDAPGLGRRAWVWLPGSDGRVSAVEMAARRPVLEVLHGRAGRDEGRNGRNIRFAQGEGAVGAPARASDDGGEWTGGSESRELPRDESDSPAGEGAGAA